MRWMSVLILSLILITFGAIGQEYGISVPPGTPVPVAPTSPESLGVKAPEAITIQGPTTSEKSQGYIQSTQAAAMSPPQGTQVTGTTSYAIIVPPGTSAVNNFYTVYSPQTTASCYLYGSLPLWMSIRSSGPCWTYEWYPNGRLVTQYIGNFFPGWYKGWFYGDAPGWHIMQYFCNGWSNYIYIYVYPYGNYNNYRTSIYNPAPSPIPAPPLPQYPIATPFSEYSEQIPLPEYPIATPY
jgi:hypothetical protein